MQVEIENVEYENNDTDEVIDESEYFYLDQKTKQVLELLKEIHDDSFLYPIKTEIEKRLGLNIENIICEKCKIDYKAIEINSYLKNDYLPF
jgi:hypothetical protein